MVSTVRRAVLTVVWMDEVCRAQAACSRLLLGAFRPANQRKPHRHPEGPHGRAPRREPSGDEEEQSCVQAFWDAVMAPG